MKFFNRYKFVLLFVVFILFAYFSHVNAVNRRREALREELVLVLAEKNALMDELNRLKDLYEFSTTPEQIEKMAREKLKMVKPNEIIYLVRPAEE